MSSTVVLTDLGDAFSQAARAIIEQDGAKIVDAQRAYPDNPMEAMRDADALLVFWYPMTAEAMDQLRRCRIILRCGIGVDNVDLKAAAERGIPVCNVPGYSIHEVADHTMALALALARRLPALEQGLRAGNWKPDLPAIPAFEDMTFAIAGFGRIAQAVAERVRPFRFRLVAYDPYLPDSVFAEHGVERVGRDALLQEADILSLHMPMTAETRWFINEATLRSMKSSSLIVNTARGGLVDTVELAKALQRNAIAGAGLDVFEDEPLPPDHPILSCPNTIVTPHYAWHSARSGPKLHRMAAEEIVRALRGEPLHSCVNCSSTAAVPSETSFVRSKTS